MGFLSTAYHQYTNFLFRTTSFNWLITKHQTVHLSIYLSIYLTIYLSIYLSTYISMYMCIQENCAKIDYPVTRKPECKPLSWDWPCTRPHWTGWRELIYSWKINTVVINAHLRMRNMLKVWWAQWWGGAKGKLGHRDASFWYRFDIVKIDTLIFAWLLNLQKRKLKTLYWFRLRINSID